MHSEKLDTVSLYEEFESYFSYGSEALAQECSLKSVFEYHNRTGGGRTRARLALECCSDAGLSQATSVRLAAACECLHQASLLHDDIMDSDDQRRGREAVWSKFGSSSAICLGDELIGAAFSELSQIQGLKDTQLPDLIRYASRAISRSAAGQVLDCSFKSQEQTSLEHYEKASGSKSGPLLALPFGLTMIAVGEDENCFACLDEITTAFGTAYQLLDDFEDRETDYGEQLNGYWVMFSIVGNHNGARALLSQRYHWYRRVMLKGLNCLPTYCHGALNSLYRVLAGKAKAAGLLDE